MKKWDEQEVAKVRELLERGMSARQVGDYLYRTKNAVLGLIGRHPALRAYYNPRTPDALEKRRNRMRSQETGRESVTQRNYVTAAAADAEAYRQFANFPRDTRSLTGRLAGDPLPGRSALDMRKQQETRI